MTKCCDVKIGKMRHKVELQVTTEVNDEMGGRTKTAWVLEKNMRAEIVTKSGSTRLFAQAKDMPVTHTFRTRYFSGWDPANANKKRFKFGNRFFKIWFIDNIEEENKFLEYTVVENTPT